MPSTVNGIGTHYYGKRNLESETGLCEACGNAARLDTYETTLFFVVIYIPIIPLGKKQVIDDCAICRRHRVLPTHEWKHVRQEAIESSQTQLAEKMDDPKAAIEHMQTLTAFQQKQEAHDLSGILEKTHAQDFDVQLFLGMWHERYGTRDDSNRCFEMAYRISPENPMAIRAKAVGLLEENDPESAEKLLNHLKPPSKHYDPTLFYMLGSTYQKTSQHEKSLEIFGDLIKESPEIGKEKAFRKSVRDSEKAAFRTDSILPKRSLLSSTGVRWALAISFLLAGLIAYNYYVASNRVLRIVNGIRNPITVKIDGESVDVRSESHADFPIGEGVHQASYQDGQGEWQTKEFEIRTSYFSRYFSKPAFLLNPTKTALIYKESTTYMDDKNPGFQDFKGSAVDRANEFYTQFDHSDYGYKEFPSQIELSSKSSKVVKTRVDYVPFESTVFLSDELTISDETKMQVFENYIDYHSDPYILAIYTALGTSLQQQDRCIKYLESKLDTQPVDIQVHRQYQTLLELDKVPTQEIVKRYDQYLAEHPDDANYLYLRGRLEHTFAATRKFFDPALQNDPNNPFVVASLGYCEMSAGNFESAVTRYQKATELAPENAETAAQYQAALLASQEFDQLESILESESDDNFNFKFSAKLLKLTDADEARRKKLTQTLLATNPQSKKELALYAKLFWNELDEDNALFAKTVATMPDSAWKQALLFQHAIETGNVKKGSEIAKKLKYSPSHNAMILLAIAKHQSGDKQAAMSDWMTILSTLKTGDDRFVADLIQQSADREVSTDEFLQIIIDVNRKKIIALAMMEFGCKIDSDWKAMIKKLNFDPQYPHHFINNSLDR